MDINYASNKLLFQYGLKQNDIIIQGQMPNLINIKIQDSIFPL